VAARVGVEDVGAHEVHHTVPRCLLSLRDRADAHPEFDGEGIQLWLDYELEALRTEVCGSTKKAGARAPASAHAGLRLR
jgi:hypothetical protein